MKLEAHGIAINFGQTSLLQGVDVSVATGEMVGLIGPNGSGKTTLLRILANLRAPDGGSVSLDGRDIKDIGERELSKLISYLAQGGDAHWPMRVETLVALGRLPHRRPFRDQSACDRDAVERALVTADVSALRRRPMARLSGGERMRVLLARALAVETSILIADEPVAALDPLHQLKVMELLRASARKGTGIIVVLHDLSLAARFCDRLVLIAQGGIVAQGSSGKVLTRAHLAKSYGVDVLSGTSQGIPYFLPRQAVTSIEDKI
jgi:iron complex transport system ATP-binding protein